MAIIKFVSRIFFFSIFTVAISQLICSYVFPFYYGNKDFAQIYSKVENDNVDYDLFFIGTSRLARGVNIKIVDSVLQTDLFNSEIKTANLAILGSTVFENIYILENLIKKYPGKTFIIEVQNSLIGTVNTNVTKNKYFLSYKWRKRLANAIVSKKLKKPKNPKKSSDVYTQHQTKSLIELRKLFHLNLLPIGQFETITNSMYWTIYPSLKFENRSIRLNNRSKYLQIENKRFKTKENNFAVIKQYYNSLQTQTKPFLGNETILKEYLELINLGEKYSCNLLFTYPVSLSYNFHGGTLGNYDNLPESNKIPLIGDSFFKKHLMSENAWNDRNHLVKNGANVYSKELARLIAQHLKQYPNKKN